MGNRRFLDYLQGNTIPSFSAKFSHTRTVTLRHCPWVLFEKGEQGRLAFAKKSLFYFFFPNMTTQRKITATSKPNMAAFLPSGGEAI